MIKAKSLEDENTIVKKIGKVNRYLSRGLRFFEVDFDEVVEQYRIEINLDELNLNDDIKCNDETKCLISLDIDSKHFKTKFFKTNEGCISLYNEKFVYYDKIIPYQIRFRLDSFSTHSESSDAYRTIAESDVSFHFIENFHKKEIKIPLYKIYKNPSLQISYTSVDNDPSNVYIDVLRGISFNDPFTMKHPLTFFLKVKVYDKKKFKTKMKTNVYNEVSDPEFNKSIKIELKKDVYYYMLIEIMDPVSRRKIYSSKEIKLSYNELKSLKKNNEQWIELYKKKKYMQQTPVGNLNMNISFYFQQILPESKYDDLYKLLLAKNMYIIEYIEENCRDINEKKKILSLLLRIFHIKGQSEDFIKSIMKRELNKTWDYEILFRENTSACLSMEIYMNMIGKEYIKEIMNDKYTKVGIEVSDDEDDDHSKEEEKVKNIEAMFVKNFIDSILIDMNRHVSLFPISLKNILFYIRKEVMKKFDRQDDRSITSFIFLRFICVALAHPHHYDVINDIPTNIQSKLYIQLSKTFIKITNYAFNESYKSSLSEWEKNKVVLIESFINSLLEEDIIENTNKDKDATQENNKKSKDDEVEEEEEEEKEAKKRNKKSQNDEPLIVNKKNRHDLPYIEYMNDMNMIHEWFYSNVSQIKSESDKLNEIISTYQHHYNTSMSNKSSSEKIETKNNEIDAFVDTPNKKMSQSSDQVLLKRSRSKSGSSFYGSYTNSSLSKSSNHIDKIMNMKFLKSYKECIDKLLENVLILKEITKVEDGRIRSISMSG